jgi:uncharacterized protein (TIGR00296 family)
MRVSEARRLIMLARDSIMSRFLGKRPDFQEKGEKRGVFITLLKDGELRGCIGFPEPVLHLERAVFEAAWAAAFSDPRFFPISESEMEDLCIEISVLTRPMKLEGDPLKSIEIGRTGLIVKKGHASGLLLPQVAVEYGWDAKKFLENTCRKAGLSPDDWKTAEIFSFGSEVFKETEPRGKVVRVL